MLLFSLLNAGEQNGKFSSPIEWTSKFSNAGGWHTSAAYYGTITYPDLNGDGLPDIAHHYNHSTGQMGYWVQINSGSGFSDFQNWGANATQIYQHIPDQNSGTFKDVNGDGLPDRIHQYNYQSNQYGYWVQINLGNSFGEFQDWGQNTPQTTQYKPIWDGNSQFQDVNGDGLPDRVHLAAK